MTKPHECQHEWDIVAQCTECKETTPYLDHDWGTTIRDLRAEKVSCQDDYDSLLDRLLEAVGVSTCTGKHIVEHVQDLRAENERLKRLDNFCFIGHHDIEGEAVCAECHAAELATLTRERDEAREALGRLCKCHGFYGGARQDILCPVCDLALIVEAQEA